MTPGEMTLGILCGGKSRRMGRDKATLSLDGETLLTRSLRLERIFAGVMISVGADASEVSGFRTVRDVRPDCGPLEGLCRLLEACETPYLMVLPVDMPYFTEREVRLLASAANTEGPGVVLTEDGRLDPLCAVYPKAALPLLKRLMEEGERRAGAFADRCGALRIDSRSIGIQPEALFNLNTPEDLKAAAQKTGDPHL